MESVLPLLLVGPIAILLLVIATATVRYVRSSRSLQHQSQLQRKNASYSFVDNFPTPSAPSRLPLRRSLSEVINEEERRAEQSVDEFTSLSVTSTPFQRRDSVGNGHLVRNTVVVHSPVSAASPSLPHPPPSPFLWTRPPAFSPQYINNLTSSAAAASPASRRSLPPLPSSASTSTTSSVSVKPSASPSVAGAVPSRKRGASPHIISLSDAIGLSQPDKRSRHARARDVYEDVEMTDSGARRRAKRKEQRRSREEDREYDEDGLVDLDDEMDNTATKSSKRRNVLASPATTRRQTISENELRRRKRTGKEADGTSKRVRTIETDEEAEEQEMEEEEGDENTAHRSHEDDSLAVNVDDSAAADHTTEADHSTAPTIRPPSTPSHLMPLAPASPFLPSVSTAVLDPTVRRKSGRAPYKSRHSLPAPTVLNSSWVRDGEEETEEEKAVEETVNQMLEQGLKGSRRFDKNSTTAHSKQPQQEEQKAEAGGSAAGFPQQSSTALPTFSFTVPSMSTQPATASSNAAGTSPSLPFSNNAAPSMQPSSSAHSFSFGGSAAGSTNAAMPSFSTSSMPPSTSNPATAAPFSFTAPPQPQPINTQSTQFTSAASSTLTTPFTFPSSSASPPPSSAAGSSFVGFSGSGLFGASGSSQPTFGGLPTSQPLQSHSSSSTAADSGGSGFRAPNRGARGGKGRTGGRR